mgnify:FL=1
MQPIRLIVSDLDGTLLSESHRLTPEVREAVQEFTAGGGLFTFATGRPYLTVKPIAETLGITIPFICCNSSVTAENENIVRVDYLPIDDLQGLIAEADRQGITALVFRERTIDAIRRTEAVEQFEIKEQITCRIAGQPELLPKQNIHKMLLIGDMGIIQPLWASYTSGFQGKYAAFQSEHNYLEIIPGGQSKGTAMRTLMSQLHLSANQVMALGNRMNDLESQ